MPLITVDIQSCAEGTDITSQVKERKPIRIRKDHSKLHPPIQSSPVFIQPHPTCTHTSSEKTSPHFTLL